MARTLTLTLPSLPPRDKLLRIGLIILALFTMVMGMVAYFDSDWTILKLYKMCKIWMQVCDRDPECPVVCPPISGENYFVTILVICVLGAIGSLLLTQFNKDYNNYMKLADFTINAVFGFLLLIGAIVFIASAVQSHQVVLYCQEGNGTNGTLPYDYKKPVDEWDDNWIVKILAAIIALFQVALHEYLAVELGIPLQKMFMEGGFKAHGTPEEATPQRSRTTMSKKSTTSTMTKNSRRPEVPKAQGLGPRYR